MPRKRGVPLPVWSSIRTGLTQILAIVEADLRKLRHDPFELFTRMIQPAIWLLIFGQAMTKAGAMPVHESSYLDYMAPGIIAQSVLFIAIFFGIALIWERDMGILQKIFVTPSPRLLLVAGRAIAAGFRSIAQAVAIFFLSYLLGIHLRIEFLPILGVLAMVMLGGAIFSTLSLTIAAIVKKRERFIGIGQVLTMPLFFASNALYPLDDMPRWLQNVSVLNPLTYQVDALRYLMIVDEVAHFGLVVDFGVSLAVLVVLLLFATRIYPRILY